MLRAHHRPLYSAAIIGKIESLIGSRNAPEVSRLVCAIKPGEVSESDWSRVVQSVVRSPIASQCVAPLMIASASVGHSIPLEVKKVVGELAVEKYTEMSSFDKIVFVIGCSQSGVRTPEIIDFVNRFLVDIRTAQSMDAKFIPSFMLAVANLGVANELSWNYLISTIQLESYSIHEIVNLTLAIVTSKTFPIALLERILNHVGPLIESEMTQSDANSFGHSLCCLELFQSDVLRTILNKISAGKSLDTDGLRLLKQIILSMFILNGQEVIQSVSPLVLQRLDKLVGDWSLSEPQRHHPNIAGEIQRIVEELKGDDVKTHKVLPLAPLERWDRQTAISVAMNRFYTSDVENAKQIFVHIDDETYPDLEEGPIDPYIQLKHLHIQKAGYQLVWVREAVWEEGDWEEKVEFIKMFLNS